MEMPEERTATFLGSVTERDSLLCPNMVHPQEQGESLLLAPGKLEPCPLVPSPGACLFRRGCTCLAQSWYPATRGGYEKSLYPHTVIPLRIEVLKLAHCEEQTSSSFIIWSSKNLVILPSKENPLIPPLTRDSECSLKIDNGGNASSCFYLDY